MGLFDPWMMGQQFGGLLGGGTPGYSQSDIDALIKGYGQQWGKLPAADAPQISMDPSGSAPMGSAPSNPYGNPAGIMPTPTSTVAAGDPQQQPGGPWVRPGSLLDKFISTAGLPPGVGPAAAAVPQPAPYFGSGAEPSAVWGGPAPQMANVPMPQPRPPGLGQQPAAQSPGPPLSILPPGGNEPPVISSPAAGAMAQAVPQQSGPGVGDRLSAGFQGFANAGSPMQALGNLVGGLASGQRQDYHARLQETGVDPLTGEKSFAWVDPVNRTMTPATSSGGTPGGNTISPLVNAVRAGVAGDKLWEYVPREYKGRLTAMLEGREAPPSGAGMRNPQIQALLTAAHAIDPTFDETSWGKRFTLIKNYQAGGKQFQEIQAINTVAGHFENLKNAAEALNNTRFPLVNGIVNWAQQNAGDPRVDRLNTVIQAVTTELSKAYKAGHVSDADVRLWRDNVNSAKSPEQFKAVIGELNDLLASKRNAIEEGFKQGMGATPLPKEFSAESERARKTFESVADWSLGGKPAGKPSGGWTVKKVQ